MEKLRNLPRQSLIGLILILVCWPLNWGLSGPRTSYLFFPLWLGYILVVDGWVLLRSGTSLLTRLGPRYPLLFLLSTPAWWLFEAINVRTQNWEYLGGHATGDVQSFILSSLSFSTVIPAVFGTAELMGTTPWSHRFSSGPRIRSTNRTPLHLLLLGFGMVALTLLWPRYFYPLVWCGVFMILEPINMRLRRPSLIGRLTEGNWRPAVCLSTGALACGFFWEMWNFFSSPKWIYHVPGVGVFHIFEMPILGYLGYVPFAWELYALCYFLWPKAPTLKI